MIEPESSLRITRAILLESERPRASEAGQSGDTRIADGKITECAPGLAADDEPGNAAIDQCCSKAAAVAKLIDDRIGNIFHRTIDQDLVVGRVFGPPCLERAF